MAVTVSVAESITFTLDPEVFDEEIILPAIRAAMEVIAEEARENLEPHQSRVTGTAMWWTDKAKERAYYRLPLIESIRVGAFISDGEPVGFVYVHSDAAHIGRFLEYGIESDRKRVYGNYTGRDQEPKPFMRPAYENRRLKAMSIFRKMISAGLKKRQVVARREAA